jgi:pyridoxamine 5'-phosphate oxidase family protein
MSAFTDAELGYLTGGERRLARVATVGKDGMPHVTPVGWSYNAEQDTIDIGGHNLPATKKYKDALRTGMAALVIDDVLPPWRPRGIEVRGDAEVLEDPGPLLRVRPRRIVSWGLESDSMTDRYSRAVPR